MLSAIVPIKSSTEDLTYFEDLILNLSDNAVELIVVEDLECANRNQSLKRILLNGPVNQIRYLSGHFGSPGIARNAGLKIAKGDWITFWDCDDQPRVTQILNAIKNTANNTEILIGQFLVKNQESGEVNQEIGEYLAIDDIAINPGLWRMVFRKKILSRLQFSEFRMGEDQLFISHLDISNKIVQFVPAIFYEYTIGLKHQLTRQPLNLKFLLEVSNAIYEKAKSATDLSTINFDCILITRQQITLLKRGNFFLKIKAIKFLIKFAFNFKLIIPFFKSILKIISRAQRCRMK